MNPEPSQPGRWVWTMGPISRPDLVARANRLGWPSVTYAGTVICGREAWTESAWLYAHDRREAWEQLDEIERTNGGNQHE